MIKQLLDMLKHIADLCLNKYTAFYCGVFIFLMSLFYRFRLFLESKNNLKLRAKAIKQLCLSNWEPEKSDWLDSVNSAIKPFSVINTISQELFCVDLFDNNGEPIATHGLEDCRLIPMQIINHFVDLYNNSIFSGFWSIFLKPLKTTDEKCFTMGVLTDKNDKSKQMVLVIKPGKEYISIFKFTNESVQNEGIKEQNKRASSYE